MKRTFFVLVMTVLLAACIFSVTAFADGAAKIEFDSVEAAPGDTVTLDLKLTENPGIAGLLVSLDYNKDAMTYTSVKRGSLFSGFTAAKNYAWDEDDDVTSTGVLASFTFQIAENAVPGSYEVNVIVRTCTNIDFDDVNCVVIPGVITIKGAETDAECVTLKGANLTLEGEIGVNIYMDIPESLEDGTLLFSFRGNTRSVPISQLPATEYGRKATYLVAVKEMNDLIGIQILDKDGAVQKMVMPSGAEVPESGFTYSVMAYLTTHSDGEGNLADFARKMASYGAYAQKLLNYQADTAVGGDVSGVSLETVSGYAHQKNGTLPVGVNVTGMKLALESKTAMRIYFTAANLKDCTVTVDGKVVQPVQDGNSYHVDISNIAAKDLDTVHTVVFSDQENSYTIQVSGLTYSYLVLKNSGSTEAEKNVGKALYLYCMAAKKVVQ